MTVNTYTRDRHGGHLAVYVQPISPAYTDADYVTHFVPVAKIFLLSIFKRWRGLRTFDVCQEPLREDDPRPEPPPVTQLYVTRAGAEHMHWHNATIADVLEASTHTRPATKTTGAYNDVSAYFHARLGTQPALIRARAATGATTTTSTTTSSTAATATSATP